MLPFTTAEAEAYIRKAALARGIDPDIAVRVARSEGLRKNTWQSDVILGYGREQSYGPFQLHKAPKGHRAGLGDAFLAKTGLDPSDPQNWKQGIDFALDTAATSGWGPWFGAKKIGITGMDGIRNGKALGVSNPVKGAIPVEKQTFYPQGGGPYAEPIPKPQPGLSAPQVPPTPVKVNQPQIISVAAPAGNFKPTGYQKMMLRSFDKGGDPSQLPRLMRAIGLNEKGTARLYPRGTNSPGLMELLNLSMSKPPVTQTIAPKIPAMSGASSGGLLSFISKLFG